MSLTDVLGRIGGQQGQQGQQAGVSTIAQLFGGSGLQDIMASLQSNGLGQHIQSWIGSGQNMQVSGQDIQQAMDQDQLQQVAQQRGMSPDELSDHVAQALPNLVDQATPNGQVPQQGGIGSLMSGLR